MDSKKKTKKHFWFFLFFWDEEKIPTGKKLFEVAREGVRGAGGCGLGD